MKNIVVLTGAGISQESGLETFRASDGTWAKFNVADVATPGGFRRNPALVHAFYNARRRQLLSGDIHPNEAHLALADLQRQWRGEVTIVTQNIDDLHERAGASVLHIHGELLKARCSRCGGITGATDDIDVNSKCTACGTTGSMRPHVVWFEEMPMHLDVIVAALEKADLFLSIGTSGTVYPAAGFVEIAKRAGTYTVELNLEESAGASLFDERIYGPATRVVRDCVSGLLAGQHGS